jgi:gliding motility-associatede transport system auxiliary component
MSQRLHPLTKSQRALAGLGLALVLLLAVNIFSNVVLRPYQLDLTENKLFTVSQGTRDIIKGVDEPVVLRLFFTKTMGEGNPGHVQRFVRVKELLERYASQSDGRIRLELLDAAPFSPAEDKAVAFGLTGVPYNEAGDLGYFGLVGTNSTDDVETVRYFAAERENFLEYDLSKVIYRLTNPRKKVVGLISSLPIGGAGTMPGQEGPPWPIIQTIRDFFEIKPLPPYVEQIPDDIDVLWIVHPHGFDDHALYAIDQFVLKGGRALVFVDPMFESSARMGMTAAAGSSRSELNRLLNAWGLAMAPDKVAGDLDAARRVRVRREGRIAVADYVAWLTLGQANLDLDDAITGDIKKLNLGTPGILEPLGKPGLKITPLVTTGLRSMAIDIRNFTGQTDVVGLFRNFQPSNHRLILAARSTGIAKTAFPQGLPKVSVPSADGKAKASAQASPAQLTEAKTPINVIVVADVDMLHDDFWADVENKEGQESLVPNSNNVDFVINALDNLTGSNALIQLRGRSNVSRPFHLIQRIRQDAEQQFRKKEEALQQRLAQARTQMESIMERNTRDNRVTLAPNQRAELDSFRKEMLTVRRELRDVQHALRTDLDRLDDWLKFLNIAAIPLLLVVGVMVVSVYRRRRRPAGHHE